jgi:hypothetical protein
MEENKSDYEQIDRDRNEEIEILGEMRIFARSGCS